MKYYVTWQNSRQEFKLLGQARRFAASTQREMVLLIKRNLLEEGDSYQGGREPNVQLYMVDVIGQWFRWLPRAKCWIISPNAGELVHSHSPMKAWNGEEN